ncbi:MAG: DNA adenine methylase [Deltaproteobacteria bacterium]|nr:DNA adenine methylase [Deltaproteobacteria bacterium]
MIKYIGSKRVLVPRIAAAVGALPGVRTVLDLFSGTARVGHALKRAGYLVTANDHLAYAEALARCYVAADRGKVGRAAEKLIGELREVKGREGYFTATFCVRSRYLHPRNGERVDAIREAIAAKGLEPELEAVLLVSLMEAADRVDSTTGLQMAYLKKWAARAMNDLELRMPEVLEGGGRATRMEAAEAAAGFEVDVAYVDPPYNQHSYLGNYHVWESLVRWDKPEVYGTACKRVDCREYHSPFNSKRRIREALEGVLGALRARWIIVSFSDEGFVRREEMEGMLGERGHVETVPIDFKRYVGAQIGIYNPRGEKVGRVSHVRNTEYLYLVGPEREALRRAAEAATNGAQCSLALG